MAIDGLFVLNTLRKKLQLQEWLTSNDEPRRGKPTIDSIATGDRLTFGAMPQAQLSGKRFIVGAPAQYNFSSTQLTSYPLFDEEFNQVCHMIVAKVKNKAPYLAISRKLEQTRAEEICTEDDYQRLKTANYPHHLYVRKHTGDLQDWLHLHYANKIKNAKGTKILPDQDVKSFSYTLYVAEEQFKAIEIERHANGEFDVYATIFRPVSDIVEIKHQQRRAQEPKISTPDENATLPTALVSDIVQTEETEEEREDKIITLPTALKVSTQAPVAHTNETLPSLASQQPQNISCNLRMASKLIDEAMSNDMRVTDVIRKAIGLKIAESDTVQFDLKLTAKDYEILAERFDLDPSDTDKIHALIMEELSHFTGEELE